MPHAPTPQAQQLWQRQRGVNDQQNSYGTIVDDVYESYPEDGWHADYMQFDDFGHVENGNNSSTDEDCGCDNTFDCLGKYQEDVAPQMVAFDLALSYCAGVIYLLYISSYCTVRLVLYTYCIPTYVY